MATPSFAAIDIGASGGRVMRGTVEGDRLTLDTAHRFSNGVTRRNGHLRWDFEYLAAEIDRGVRAAGAIASIGISTWGVDYGLLDARGRLIEDPISYRDDRTIGVVDKVHEIVPPADLYCANGLQFLHFNTLYQLAAEQPGPRWDRAEHLLLLPDLLAHRLTGALGTEVTNASTTGLLDATTRQWSDTLIRSFAIDPHVLGNLEEPGEIRGTTRDGTPVTSVASHDTASAVVAVPATNERFAYIVSGTWSLVGVELPGPVLTEDARAANFTNEAGVDGTTRFLRNVGGFWLLQECMRTWKRDDVAALLVEAGAVPAGGATVDVDDPTFIAPGDMPRRIADAAGEPLSVAETVRCILDSLAVGYARTIDDAAQLSGRTIDVVHIVGGGSQNDLLCQLTADATGRTVLAGPVEATARGNVVVQARTHGILSGSIDDLRARLGPELRPRRFEPR